MKMLKFCNHFRMPFKDGLLSTVNQLSLDVVAEIKLKVLAYIDIITSSLSILGAGSIIVAVLCKCRACLPEVHPIFQLSCADFLASFALCVSTVIFLLEHKYNLHAACPWLVAIITSLYVTTFFLTMLYAVEVFRRMRLRLQGIYSSNHTTDMRNTCGITKMSIAFIIAWVLPITTALIYVAIPKELASEKTKMAPIVPDFFKCETCVAVFHYNEDLCWEDEFQVHAKNLVAKYLFLIPLATVIVANFVFYILTIYVFRQTQMTRGVLGYHQYKEEKRIRNKAVLYQLVFIVCWLPTLVLGFISLSSSFNMQKFMWLYIIQACLSPLQGFFNCIIYGWKRKGFTQALYETQPLTSTNMPSYSDYSL